MAMPLPIPDGPLGDEFIAEADVLFLSYSTDPGLFISLDLRPRDSFRFAVGKQDSTPTVSMDAFFDWEDTERLNELRRRCERIKKLPNGYLGHGDALSEHPTLRVFR
jgi:hypothetical protein